MSDSPFERAGSLRVGHVDYVAPDEIRGKLDVESPESVALNTGNPKPFPRVNSYLLIRVDDAFLVGQVEWLTIELSPFPKRRGMRDFGVVDLPYPLRRIRLNPLGMLRKTYEGEHKEELESKYDFQRGSEALPSVGTAILLPTERQLRAIIESGKNQRVRIGTSPLAGDTDVHVDPNRLFGRHFAVLGNTGSGKSCSVAGLIRWSLEAAGRGLGKTQPNARFIILDPNGEYSRAFKGDSTINARIFKVEPDETKGEKELRVPLWLWNSEEWLAFTQASSKTQRPLLLQALRNVKHSQVKVGDKGEEGKQKLLSCLKRKRSEVRRALQTQEISNKECFRFAFYLEMAKTDIKYRWQQLVNVISLDDNLTDSLGLVGTSITEALNESKPPNSNYYGPFSEERVENILECLQGTIGMLETTESDEEASEDIPVPFSINNLVEHLEILAEGSGSVQYIEPLKTRIQTLLSNPRMKEVIGADTNIGGNNLEQWLQNHISSNNTENHCVSIIDLSLVPTQIIHIVTAVIARMVFEALQRYMKLNGATLPTVLVMEEAHTFVKSSIRRYSEDADDYDAASICCQVFERIAREGRKFGLGLVISSQRPSEISPTVLSQCNTFLLHRISNDRDQERVQSLVPDNLRGLLRELPLLPSQRAILLGWASELPVLVKMRNLPPEHQPQSDDPDIWEVWTREVERKGGWDEVAKQWLNITPQNQTNQGNKPSAQQKSEGQK